MAALETQARSDDGGQRDTRDNHYLIKPRGRDWDARMQNRSDKDKNEIGSKTRFVGRR